LNLCSVRTLLVIIEENSYKMGRPISEAIVFQEVDVLFINVVVLLYTFHLENLPLWSSTTKFHHGLFLWLAGKKIKIFNTEK